MKYAVFNGFMFDSYTLSETEELAMGKFLEKYGHLGPEPKEADLDIRPVHPIDHVKHTLAKYRMPEDKIERQARGFWRYSGMNLFPRLVRRWVRMMINDQVVWGGVNEG